MELDFDVCLRAAASRDQRFDGRFFIGVHSTGIYCRPICPAPAPKPANVRFYPTAAAAAAAGLRPCRRCRPETAPGTPEWLGGSAMAARALRLIGQGYLDRHSVLDLAQELHVSERQLRRLFKAHLGAGPTAVGRVRRAQVARLLVDQTDLPMARVAFEAGYTSVRQFNDELRRAFGQTPTELRRARRARTGARGDALELRLPYRPPFAWRQLLGYLGARAIPGVETVAGNAYRRTARLAAEPGLVELEDDPTRSQLVLRLTPAVVDGIAGAVERTRRLADLDADPLAVEGALTHDARLRPLVVRTPGLRVPGCWDAFELAVRAILGQQVTVRGASTLAGRLAQTFGDAVPAAAESATARLFPTPGSLAEADIARIGMPETRAEAIRALARAVLAESVRLDPGADPVETIAALEALPGIGPWTARYVAMRALRDPDAFPASDLGLRHALALNGRPASAREVAAAAEPWRPWRAYAAVHLWHGLSPTLEEAA